MEYTKFFAQLIKENGSIQLRDYQLNKFFNIVHLEGCLRATKHIKKGLLDTPDHHKYDLLQFTYQKQLTELTGNLKPSELFQEMLMLNKNY